MDENKTTQINYKLVAMKLGEGLKYETTLNEIERNASVTFDFECEEHPMTNITSERSQSIFDWVMTLSEQMIPDEGKISQLKNFIRMFDLPWNPYSELLEGTGLTAETSENDSALSINVENNFNPELNESEKSRKIFVIHGRNELARKALFQFLRAIDLEPLEWSQLIAGTGKGSPYIGEVLDQAFNIAQAVIVLMTGDDIANIRDIYLGKDEKPEPPSPQARPNVLFEAGMAFGRNPDKTIIVELGETRKYSDIEGRHVIKMDDSPEKRSALVERLKIAGCLVKTEGKDDWYKDGDFEAAIPPDDSQDEVKINNSSNKAEEIEEEVQMSAPIHVPIVSSLSGDAENILKFINDYGENGVLTKPISEALGLNHGRVKHYINQLDKSKYVYYDRSDEFQRLYRILDRGLEYLVEHDII